MQIIDGADNVDEDFQNGEDEYGSGLVN